MRIVSRANSLESPTGWQITLLVDGCDLYRKDWFMKALVSKNDILILDTDLPVEGDAVECEGVLEGGVLKITLPGKEKKDLLRRSPAYASALARMKGYLKHPVACDIDTMADALEVEDK